MPNVLKRTLELSVYDSVNIFATETPTGHILINTIGRCPPRHAASVSRHSAILSHRD